MDIKVGQPQENYIQTNSKKVTTTSKKCGIKSAISNIAQILKTTCFMALPKANKNQRYFKVATEGRLNTVKTPRKADAQIGTFEKDSTQLALHKAIAGGHADVLQDLLKLGCDINQQDHLGRTPLFLAVEMNQIECVRELLNQSANANLVDHRNWSPLHIATQFGREEIIELLLTHGANPNLRSRTHNTPADLSIVLGKQHIARKLLLSGGVVSQNSILDPILYQPLNRGALNLISEFIANNQYNTDVDLSETLPDLMQESTLLDAIKTRRNHIQTELVEQYKSLNHILNAPTKDTTKVSIDKVLDQIPNIAQYALNYPSRSLADLMFPDLPKLERKKSLIEWMDSLAQQQK